MRGLPRRHQAVTAVFVTGQIVERWVRGWTYSHRGVPFEPVAARLATIGDLRKNYALKSSITFTRTAVIDGMGRNVHVVNISVNDRSEFGVSDALHAYMERIGYAPSTIQQRLGRLAALRVDPRDATRDDVLASIPTGLQASSKRVYVAALSAAYRDLITLGICDTNPAAGIRIPGFHRGTPRPVPDGDLDVLLDQTGRERDWTVLGAFAGLRSSDVANLYAEDLVDGRMIELDGKGGVKASLPAHPLIVDVFDRAADRGPLWRVGSGRLSSVWSAWAFDITGHRYQFHQLRHSFATRIYRASGQDLIVTRDLMRHSSVATTQIYAGVEDPLLVAAVVGL